MLTLKVYGNYSPNTVGLPGSCYLLDGLSRKVIFDLGNGNFKSLKKDLSIEEMKKALIILSHNHIDHSWDVIKLAKYLITKKEKVDIYLPKKSLMFWIITRFKKAFNIHILNESVKINIDEYEFTFCRTIHKGESYATKLCGKNISFVYTSDMARVSNKVKLFCKDADIALIDSGHPCKDELFSLEGYHGKTKDILNQLFGIECNVKKILASHLKANLKREIYLKVFPPNKDIILVKRGMKYSLI